MGMRTSTSTTAGARTPRASTGAGARAREVGTGWRWDRCSACLVSVPPSFSGSSSRHVPFRLRHSSAMHHSCASRAYLSETGLFLSSHRGDVGYVRVQPRLLLHFDSGVGVACLQLKISTLLPPRNDATPDRPACFSTAARVRFSLHLGGK
ncbi:hypothetical protein B0H13DRAFT_2128842 [Mycena leptocephala]|nr:hypothetical protein B0H13DRAFT_2128842 [Mycena leptocephala]